MVISKQSTQKRLMVHCRRSPFTLSHGCSICSANYSSASGWKAMKLQTNFVLCEIESREGKDGAGIII
ncbi:hypothetical protein OIU77_018983 [Salix suchowensis]|uniref:Uncharacterized protein n=1 Tax=Salix suchowensis TaxID=1278906 RepID=A0ABQ9CHR8_9ROSI|nr:hypothetical protein OIU77_018983 [Salix suchowensis]